MLGFFILFLIKGIKIVNIVSHCICVNPHFVHPQTTDTSQKNTVPALSNHESVKDSASEVRMRFSY